MDEIGSYLTNFEFFNSNAHDLFCVWFITWPFWNIYKSNASLQNLFLIIKVDRFRQNIWMIKG